MYDVRVCVGCLATDVRMYSMSSYSLLQPYEQITGVQDWEGLPQTMCFECVAHVRRLLLFRDRCQRAYGFLRDIYFDREEITLQAVQEIDRRSKKLLSSLSPSPTHTTSLQGKEKRQKHKKHKLKKEKRKRCTDRIDSIKKTEDFFDIDKDEVASVKSEMEFASEFPELHDSDDEPLVSVKADNAERVPSDDAGGDFKQVKTEVHDTCGYIEQAMSKKEQIEVLRSRRSTESYRKSRYKCTVCFKAFPRRDRYDNHMLLHDTSSGDYACEVCHIRMSSASALCHHMKKNHSKKYTCTTCSHVSYNQNTAAMHAKGHQTDAARNTTTIDKLRTTAVKLTHEEQLSVFAERGRREEYVRAKFRCELCYHVSGRREGLDRHKRKHDPKISGAVACPVCRLRFKCRQAMTQHRLRCHMKRYSCHLCDHVCYSLKEAKTHHGWHKGGCKPVRPPRVKTEVHDQSGELRQTMSIEGLTQEEQMRRFMETRNSDAPFKCSVCLKGHYEAKAFHNHRLKHEPVSGKFQCDICKYRYKKRYHIQRHIVYFHKNQYRCKLCNQLFYNRMAATKHHLWHKGKVYECKHCGLRSTVLSTHLTHLRLKHPSEHVCSACGEAFVSQLGLQQHHRISHTIKDDAAPETSGPHCAECDIQFVSARAWTKHVLVSPKHVHQRAAISNGCRMCGETFSSAEALKSHRRAAHPPRFQRQRTYNATEKQARPCVQCGEMMSNAREYWTHFRRQHPGESYPLEVPMSHICEHCGKGFRCNALLAIHRNVHTGVRNYKCHLCPKSFFNPLNLRNHLVSHSEQRPHACRVCRKAFKFKSALDRHMRTHTGAKPYECEICGKAFSTSSSGRLHVRTVHHKEPAPYTSKARVDTQRSVVEGVWPT